MITEIIAACDGIHRTTNYIFSSNALTMNLHTLLFLAYWSNFVKRFLFYGSALKLSKIVELHR